MICWKKDSCPPSSWDLRRKVLFSTDECNLRWHMRQIRCVILHASIGACAIPLYTHLLNNKKSLLTARSRGEETRSPWKALVMWPTQVRPGLHHQCPRKTRFSKIFPKYTHKKTNKPLFVYLTQRWLQISTQRCMYPRFLGLGGKGPH